MQLARLLTGLPEILAVAGQTDAVVSRITSDSRQVVPGALFVAYRGVGLDSHRFIPDAVHRGASAIVGELVVPDLPVPYIQVRSGRAALAWLAAAWFGHPSRDMALVGITGTDGKTTTANLLYAILRAAGFRTGLISTVNAVISDRTYDTGLHTTTPDAPAVQQYLADMQAAGTQVAVLETTSHGLAQDRVTGCAFDVAVITNITHEHLDFHGTYEAYRDAKALLFRSLATSRRKTLEVPISGAAHGSAAPSLPKPLLKTAVLNRDDSSYEFLAAIPAERTITYGLAGSEPAPHAAGDMIALTATRIRHTPGGTEIELDITSPASSLRLVTPLIGDFNVSNILAAGGAALALGAGAAAIAAGVRAMAGVAGRMERVDRGQPFTAIVDFAHTPNALARALETARTLTAGQGRVIAVFGCAGLRDREKRALMGRVAARYADVTVLTAEDPRTESLEAIMMETASALVEAGRAEGRAFFRIPDRQRALLMAVRTARAGDVVMVCGKGHELSMCFETTEYPWRDQDALRWALDQLAGIQSPPPFILPTWSSGPPLSQT